MDYLNILNLVNVPSKYIVLNEFAKPFTPTDSNKLYLVVKNILQLDVSIPAEIKKLTAVPDYMVTSSNVIQFSPLGYQSQRKCQIINETENKKTLNENAIYIYCLMRPGDSYETSTASNIKENLIKLLAALYSFYTKKGFYVRIIEYYSKIEFENFNSNTIIYKGQSKTINLEDFMAWRGRKGRPQYAYEVVNLMNTAYTVMRAAEELNLVNELEIVSTYRSKEYQEEIYKAKNLKPLLTSFHLFGSAADVRFGENRKINLELAQSIGEKIPFAHKILVESSSLSDLEEGKGWLHIQSNPHEKERMIENTDYFASFIRKPVLILSRDLIKKDIDQFKIQPRLEPSADALAIIGTAIKESGLENIVKNNSVYITYKVFSGTGVSLSGINKTIPQSKVIARVTNQVQKIRKEGFDTKSVVDVKKSSYDNFTVRYIYNFYKDDWEEITS